MEEDTFHRDDIACNGLDIDAIRPDSYIDILCNAGDCKDNE